MDIGQKWKVQLDELDLMTMKSYLEVPRERSKFIWDVNHNSNEYYEVEILPEHSRENNYELTKCYICDIDIPIAFKKRHEQSNRHAMNLKIINIALKRMVSHNENPSQNQQTNSINFCDICSDVVKNTENHENSIEHEQFLKHDLFLKYFLSLYEGKRKISEIITEINSNFVKGENNSFFAQDVREDNENPLEIYFKKINIPKGNVKVLNNKTIRIQVENSTLDCDINNFHGVIHIRGLIQCNVCRVVFDDLNKHINTDIHITKISADLVKCCMRKINEQFHHCILCNEIVYEVEFHLLKEKHIDLLKEKYTEKSYNNRKTVDNIDDKSTINIKIYGSKLSDYNEKEKVIIKKDDYLYCKNCEVHIIGDDTDVDVHLNGEKHKLKTVETKFNNNETKFENKTESLAVNVNVSEGITRMFYDDFFEDRLNTPFCNLCNKYNSNTFVHKKKRKHIFKYNTFLNKYNIMVDKEGHFCKTCGVIVTPNLSNHVLKYHDKKLFDDKLTAITKPNSIFAFTANVNKLWCKSCRMVIDNKNWLVIYHKRTDDHKDKLANFFQEHYICKKFDDRTKKNKNYCQACDVFLKLNKIIEHIDSLSHVNKIKEYLPKLDSQALVAHNSKNLLDSVEVIPCDESKAKSYNGFENEFVTESSDSESNLNKSMELINTLIENKTGLVNVDECKTTVVSSKHLTLSKTCCDVGDNRKSAERGFNSQLTNDEREKTDNIPSASVSDTPSVPIGAWAKSLNISNSEIKKENFNPKSVSITEVINVTVDDYCKVCRVTISTSHQNAAEHIKGKRHINHLENILLDNNVKIDNNTWFCGFCLDKVEDVINHVSSIDHQKKMENNTALVCKSNDIDDKLNIDNEYGSTLPDFNKHEMVNIIKKDNCLYCQNCKVYILGDDTAANLHLNSEKHKLKTAETKSNNNITFDIKTEPSAENVNVSTRMFYDDFFEDRFNTPFCNLCGTYENNIFNHKRQRTHTSKYKRFINKYNVMADKGGHYCKTCDVFIVKTNLSNHVLRYHDKELFHEKLTAITKTNREFALTGNVNKLWCKPCRVFVDNKNWFVIYHKNTDDHKDKLADFFQEHSISKKINETSKKNKNYCQACDHFVKLSKIMKHIDSRGHVNNIKEYSPKLDSQALPIHNSKYDNITDSVSVTSCNQSKTMGHKITIKNMELGNTHIFENKTASANHNESKSTASSKDQTLSKASCDGGFNSKLTSDEQNTNIIPSASFCDPINSVIKKEPAPITEVLHQIFGNYCKVCRSTVSKKCVAEHKKGKRHINNLEKMLSDNNVKIENIAWFCGFCLVNVNDVIEHVSSMNHLKQIGIQHSLNKPTTLIQESYWERLDEAEYCFEPTVDPKYLICKYCNIKVLSHDHLRLIHILCLHHKQQKDKKIYDNYIRKLNDGYHCALCLEEFDFGTAINHMKNYKHNEQYNMSVTIDSDFLILNNIIKSNELNHKFLCQTCDELFPDSIPELLAHVESVKHECLNNLVPVIYYVIDKCVVEQETLNENKSSDISESIKQKTLQCEEENNIEVVCENPLLYCDICAKQFLDDTSYKTHETGKQHKEKINEVMDANSIKIINDAECYCKFCDLYFEISAMKHIKGFTHQGNVRRDGKT